MSGEKEMEQAPFIKLDYLSPFGVLQMQFAFCSKVSDGVWRNTSRDFQCRDYLGDYLGNIPALEVDGENKEHLDADATRMRIIVPTNQVEKFIRKFPMLQAFEQEFFDVTPSRLYMSENKTNLLIEADKIWCSMAAANSLYSLWLRVLPFLKEGQDWMDYGKGAGPYPNQDQWYTIKLGELNARKYIPLFAKVDLSELKYRSGWRYAPVTHGSGGIVNMMSAVANRSANQHNLLGNQLLKML